MVISRKGLWQNALIVCDSPQLVAKTVTARAKMVSWISASKYRMTKAQNGKKGDPKRGNAH
jgi:hypothetical protein